MTAPLHIVNIETGSPIHAGPFTGPADPPMDPEKIRETGLLNEAVLVTFVATPATLKPFGKATLAWDIRMPTTVIPGVAVEIVIQGFAGGGEYSAAPQGAIEVAPYAQTSYSLLLRTPMAMRQLGTLSLSVDASACQMPQVATGVIESFAANQVQAVFPPGGQMTLRGEGVRLDIGINSFVVTVALEAGIPNWFNADVDVTLSFEVSVENEAVVVTHRTATTKISPGAASNVLSGGVATAVADGAEAVSDGYLYAIVGPVIGQRIGAAISANVQENLDRLNHATPRPPFPLKLYDVALTQNGMTYQLCPST